MSINTGICTLNNIEILPQQVQHDILKPVQLVNTAYSGSLDGKSINIAIYFCKRVSDYKRDLSVQTHKEASIKTTIAKDKMSFTIRVSTKNPYDVKLLTLREIKKALFIYNNLPMRAFATKIKADERLAYQLLTETYASYYALVAVSNDTIRHIREVSYRSIKRGLCGYLMQGSSEERVVTTLLDRTKDILISCCNYIAASKQLGENPFTTLSSCNGFSGYEMVYGLVAVLLSFLDSTTQLIPPNSIAEFIHSTQGVCKTILYWVDTVEKNKSTPWYI